MSIASPKIYITRTTGIQLYYQTIMPPNPSVPKNLKTKLVATFEFSTRKLRIPTKLERDLQGSKLVERKLASTDRKCVMDIS